MGKRIIQRARGHGSLTYQVRKGAYIFRIGYPSAEGKGVVLRILHSTAHSAPLAKIKVGNEIFYNPACEGMYEGQSIEIGKEIAPGNIAMLKEIPLGTRVYNIESRQRDGGVFVRSAGSSAGIIQKANGIANVLMPSKQEKKFDERCRATIGIIAGAGRMDKPFVKAGVVHYKMKSRNKLWPRSSAVKMNAVDHPFGSGRGKRIKSKIAKRNAPPGAKVGLLRPRRVGRKKR
ncbi:MAG: 50S ribosomal protein L2 [Nanoarchaeota archaeon]